MGLFSAFSPLNGGTLDTYTYPNEYPYDLDAGLDYTRPATGFAMFPFPLTVGYMKTCPLLDALEFGMSKGKLPTGPVINMLTMPQIQPVAFPNIQGSMKKVKG